MRLSNEACPRGTPYERRGRSPVHRSRQGRLAERPGGREQSAAWCAARCRRAAGVRGAGRRHDHRYDGDDSDARHGALTVDVTHFFTLQRELQNAADAAAHASTQRLPDTTAAN
ncbi:MAG: hypothetical protein FJ035_01755 [Chloroflexi bacterium]|nr:hypothetical protein [Chloroflexota bacterium]